MARIWIVEDDPQIDILADGGLGGVEQRAEFPQRVYAVGRVGEQARDGAKAFIPLDLIHAEPSIPEDFVYRTPL